MISVKTQHWVFICLLSPNPAPRDLRLFLKVSMIPKGKWLESVQDTVAARTAQLKTLRKEDTGVAADRARMTGRLLLNWVGFSEGLVALCHWLKTGFQGKHSPYLKPPLAHKLTLGRGSDSQAGSEHRFKGHQGPCQCPHLVLACMRRLRWQLGLGNPKGYLESSTSMAKSPPQML